MSTPGKVQVSPFVGFFLCFLSPDGKLYAIMFGRYSKKAYLCSGKMNVRGLQSSSLFFIKQKTDT